MCFTPGSMLYLHMAHCPLWALKESNATFILWRKKKLIPRKVKKMLKGIYSTIDAGLLSRRTREILQKWWWESLIAWLIIELLNWDLNLTNSCPSFFQPPDLSNSPNNYTSDFVSQKPSWLGLLCILFKLNWTWWYKTIILPLREWNRRIRSLRSVWAT